MHREKGQSLAEIGLLLPVFLLAVMMVVDIGRAVYYYSVIYNAAREGARYGVIDMNLVANDPDVAAAVKRLGAGFLKDENINSQVISPVGPSGKAYKAIEVSVRAGQQQHIPAHPGDHAVGAVSEARRFEENSLGNKWLSVFIMFRER